MRVEAPAKVNLLLRVLEREPSGYHRVETVLQAVGLADSLVVRRIPGTSVELDVEGMDVGPPERNLAARAARAFREAAGATDGVRIRLQKRIPAGAGLGGGSSDAAATLRALHTLFPGCLTPERLTNLGAALGADVPFFLGESPLAVGEGRGDDVRGIEPLPACDVVLVTPPLRIATGAAYEALDRWRESHRTDRGRERPLPGRLGGWEAVTRISANDFEAATAARHPEVARALESLAAAGAAVARLSGSGSAVFGLFPGDRVLDDRTAGIAERAGARAIRVRTLEALPPVVAVPGDA